MSRPTKTIQTDNITESDVIPNFSEEPIEFSIKNIVPYLENIKNTLLSMNIRLDSHEINNFLATSLNTALFKLFNSDYKKEMTFQIIYDNLEGVANNIPEVEIKIREFNKKEEYKYYVNMEDIQYIVKYKRMTFIQKMLQSVNGYLQFNVNPIYIYTFVMQYIYDTDVILNDYIELTNDILSKTTNGNVKEFLTEDILYNLKLLLGILYNSDEEFKGLMKEIYDKRISFIKEGIITSSLNYYNNYNCDKSKHQIIKEYHGTEKEYSNIENLEKEFYESKCKTLFKKRQLEINENFTTQINEIIHKIINKELWFAFVLFLYKKFEFEYDDLMNKLSLAEYKPNLDDFSDIDVPNYDYKKQKPQTGGNNIYYEKYIKYKAKYLKLKNKF